MCNKTIQELLQMEITNRTINSPTLERITTKYLIRKRYTPKNKLRKKYNKGLPIKRESRHDSLIKIPTIY